MLSLILKMQMLKEALPVFPLRGFTLFLVIQHHLPISAHLSRASRASGKVQGMMKDRTVYENILLNIIVALD